MTRLNKTESAVFVYCMFSLFLKAIFPRLFRDNGNFTFPKAKSQVKKFLFIGDF